MPIDGDIREVSGEDEKGHVILCWPLRYTVIILTCMAVMNMYAQQIAIHTALGCMLNKTQLVHLILPLELDSNALTVCQLQTNKTSPKNDSQVGDRGSTLSPHNEPVNSEQMSNRLDLVDKRQTGKNGKSAENMESFSSTKTWWGTGQPPQIQNDYDQEQHGAKRQPQQQQLYVQKRSLQNEEQSVNKNEERGPQQQQLQQHQQADVQDYHMLAETLWSARYQWMMLNAFQCGSLVTMVIAGWLVVDSSGVRLLGYCHLVMSITTLFTPLTARYMQPYVVVVVQGFGGMAAGVTYPCLMRIWCNWTSYTERASLVAMSFCGIPLGVILNVSVVQVTCYMSRTSGWTALFVILGALGICWFLLWTVFVSSRPGTSSWISTAEKNVIIVDIVTRSNTVIIPWKNMLSSRSFWSMVMILTATDWMLYFIVYLLPIYLRDAFKMNLHTFLNGYFSTAPFLAFFLLVLVSGYIIKYLSVLCSIVNIRRSFCIIGAGLISSSLILLTTQDCSSSLSIVTAVITIATGEALLVVGCMVCPLDLSSRLASIIIGLSLTAAYIFRIVAGAAISYFISTGSVKSWDLTLYVSSIFVSVSVLLFPVFCHQWETFDAPHSDSALLSSPGGEERCQFAHPCRSFNSPCDQTDRPDRSCENFLELRDDYPPISLRYSGVDNVYSHSTSSLDAHYAKTLFNNIRYGNERFPEPDSIENEHELLQKSLQELSKYEPSVEARLQDLNYEHSKPYHCRSVDRDLSSTEIDFKALETKRSLADKSRHKVSIV